MQDTIKIYFNDTTKFTDLEISVNRSIVEYTKQNNFLLVTLPAHVGINILRLKLKNKNE